MRSLFSNKVTSCPARASCCAHASPAGPEPTTATLFPVLRCGTCGPIQPSLHPLSTIACSIDLIVTGSLLMLSTHAASHGAGQTRPVNSGKLLVEWSTASASRQRLRYTRSFQSGMMLLTGQPVWQNAMPQSMHRAPCFPISSSESGRTNSLWTLMRSATGAYGRSRRSISMKPVIFPMGVLVVRAHFHPRRGLLAARLILRHLRQRAAVFERHHLHELGKIGR